MQSCRRRQIRWRSKTVLFRAKPKTALKGERTKILSSFSNSLDMTYRFRVEPRTPGERISGTVEIRGSNWLFPKSPLTQPLQQNCEVHKGVWDTLYSVYVEPNVDVTVTRTGTSIGHQARLLVLISLVIAAALIVMIFVLMI